MNPKLTVFNNGTIAAWILFNALFLASCSSGYVVASDTTSQVYGSNLAVPPSDAFTYGGVDGTLNAQDITAILHLSYPQSAQAMIDRFGMPKRRDNYRDYYQVKGTNNWIAIEYNGTQAIGYRISDHQ